MLTMYATKKTCIRQPSPTCIVCKRSMYKENESYQLYKLSEKKQGYSDSEMTMIGNSAEKGGY